VSPHFRGPDHAGMKASSVDLVWFSTKLPRMVGVSWATAAAALAIQITPDITSAGKHVAISAIVGLATTALASWALNQKSSRRNEILGACVLGGSVTCNTTLFFLTKPGILAGLSALGLSAGQVVVTAAGFIAGCFISEMRERAIAKRQRRG